MKTSIPNQITKLCKIYGNVSNLSTVLDIDGTYLHRLHKGDKIEPSEEVLKKLGLIKVVTYYSKEC